MLRISPKTPPPDEACYSAVIIDDENTVRMSVTGMIKTICKKLNCDCKIDVAADGRSGWKLCEEKKYELYVVDQHTDDDDIAFYGAEVAKRIVNKDPIGRVVFYAALKENEKVKLPESVKVIPKDPQKLASFIRDDVQAYIAKRSARKNSANGDPE